MIILLFILLETQPPKLDLPKVVIYGEREVSMEIVKGELLPDTIPEAELPIPGLPKVALEKSSCRLSYKERPYLFNFRGSLGGSGVASALYGTKTFKIAGSYSEDIKKLDKGLGIKLGLSVKNLSFRAGYEIKDYQERDSYKVFHGNMGYTLPYLYLKTDVLLGELEGTRENFLAAGGRIFIPVKNVTLLTDFSTMVCAVQDNLWLIRAGAAMRYNYQGVIIEPGVKFCYSDVSYVQPSLKLRGEEYIWLEYTPSFTLITRDEALKYNRFADSQVLDKRKLLALEAGVPMFKLRGEWIQDYPYFDSSDCLKETDILAVEAKMSSKFGTLKLRYNLEDVPDYIPELLGELNFSWKAYAIDVSYGWWEDYSYLSVIFSCQILQHLSLFLQTDNLFDKKDEIFDIYYEPRRKILLGLDLKI